MSRLSSELLLGIYEFGVDAEYPMLEVSKHSYGYVVLGTLLSDGAPATLLISILLAPMSCENTELRILQIRQA